MQDCSINEMNLKLIHNVSNRSSKIIIKGSIQMDMNFNISKDSLVNKILRREIPKLIQKKLSWQSSI